MVAKFLKGKPLGRSLAIIADGLLWIAAIVGVCALLVTVAGALFGVRPLIFRSGSMTPTIAAGSLGLARQAAADTVRVGDIVSVTTGTVRVTHRVIMIRPSGDGAELHLRGDANKTADADPYRVRTVDKLWFAVPGLGYVVAWLSRPPGIFVLAGYAALMLALLFRRRGILEAASDDDDHGPGDHGSDDQGRTDHDPQLEDRSHSTLGAGARHAVRAATSPRIRAALAALLVGGAVATTPMPSWAAFTDSVPISGSSVASYTVPTTPFTCGALGVASVTFTWTAVPGATGYTLHYGNAGGSILTTTSTSYTIVTLINGGTAWVTVNRNFGSVTWSSVASTTRNYTVALVSLCS